MKLKHFLLGTSLLCGLVFPVMAKAASELSPRAEVSVKGGSERSTLTTEFWAPLAQKSDRVVYTDLRLMGDDDDNREGNLGIGYRQVYEPTNSVLGIHGWIDRRRTEHNSTFHQVTLGVESLGDKIDLRANGYIPLNDGRVVTTPNLGSTTPYLAGNGLFYDTTGSINETPQYGIDAEAGYRLPIFEKQIDTLRVYGGGYHFFRSNTDNVTGFRIRTEAQINQIVSVGARFQHDGPRGSQGFLEATLRFPFSAKKLYQKSGLVSRLDESPERDIDIVTASKVDTGLRKEITNTATGQSQHILYVDNTQTNGDGTKEHPFNNLQSAQAALQANDILYIFHGDGTTHNMDQGITISQPGVQLIGSGSALTVSGLTFLNATSAPVITNTQASIDGLHGNGVLVLANNTYISGITISGAKGSGINVYNTASTFINSVKIDNVQASNNFMTGVSINADNGSGINNIYLSNINTTSNSLYGILVVDNHNATIGNVIVNNVVTINNTVSGIHFQANNSATINRIDLNGLTSTGNATGLAVNAQNSGIINNVSLQNLNANANSSSGIYILAQTSGTINAIDLSNSIASNNTNHGIQFLSQTAGNINSINIRNTIASSNSLDGLRFDSNGAGSKVTNITGSNIKLTGNRWGLLLQSQTNGIIDGVDFHNITSNNNLQYGFYVSSQTSAVINNVSVANNNFIGNNIYGLYINDDTTGTFLIDLGGGTLDSVGMNRIFGNTSSDIRVDVDGGQLSAKNNWWGINTGLAAGKVSYEDTSTIDSTAFLTTDPRP